jgi:hypothetical protein
MKIAADLDIGFEHGRFQDSSKGRFRLPSPARIEHRSRDGRLHEQHAVHEDEPKVRDSFIWLRTCRVIGPHGSFFL